MPHGEMQQPMPLRPALRARPQAPRVPLNPHPHRRRVPRLSPAEQELLALTNTAA